MKATKWRKNPFRAFIWIAAGIAAAATIGFSGLLGLDWLESHRAFCNACHLAADRPLHEPKMKIALRSPPLDETGFHFQRAGNGDFSCVTCHRGEGLLGRSEVLWDSFRNTVTYFAGEFKEPEKIGRPIRDEACIRCHTVNEAPRNAEKFHGIRAHEYPLPVLCTECHVAHARRPDQARHLRRVMTRLERKCGGCHDVNPPTPDMVLVLQNFLQSRQR